jgi:hypothetical protein
MDALLVALAALAVYCLWSCSREGYVISDCPGWDCSGHADGTICAGGSHSYLCKGGRWKLADTSYGRCAAAGQMETLRWDDREYCASDSGCPTASVCRWKNPNSTSCYGEPGAVGNVHRGGRCLNVAEALLSDHAGVVVDARHEVVKAAHTVSDTAQDFAHDPTGTLQQGISNLQNAVINAAKSAPGELDRLRASIQGGEFGDDVLDSVTDLANKVGDECIPAAAGLIRNPTNLWQALDVAKKCDSRLACADAIVGRQPDARKKCAMALVAMAL